MECNEKWRNEKLELWNLKYIRKKDRTMQKLMIERKKQRQVAMVAR